MEEKIPLFSVVKLKDGREGTILDYYTNPTFAYGIDICVKNGGEDIYGYEWEYEIYQPDYIKEVIQLYEDNK